MSDEKRMRILWLGACWFAWDLLYSSLKSLNEHEITLIRYDPPRAGDRRIPELIQANINANENQIDAIIYVAVNGGSCMPSTDELKTIKKIAPTVMISIEASDTIWCGEQVKEYYEEECFDLIVNVDGNPDWPYSEHGLTRLYPVDITRWKRPKNWNERQHVCGTWGGIIGLREQILTILGDAVTWHRNIPARPEFEEEDNLRSYDLYVDFYRDCKSVLNFAGRGGDGLIGLIKTGDTLIEEVNGCLRQNRTHVKARVIEAGLAGATLIEQAKAETSRWFKPGEDYLTFTTVEEIRQQIHWVESHPDEAQKIANNLRAKILREHTPKIFWDDVFNKLFKK